MPRHLYTAELSPGTVELDPVQSHHARHVLRLADGDVVELFDPGGRWASGVVVPSADQSLAVQVEEVHEPAADGLSWTVAAAVPKGERADWMVEKLSELGCHAFVPLLAERSVVQPKGTGKRDRWVRLATESAKQCRRRGVMRIETPTTLDELLENGETLPPGALPVARWFLDLSEAAVPIRELLLEPPAAGRLTMLIGPEGGWTRREVDRMLAARLTAISLTPTILRIETAVVAAAACVASLWVGRR